MAAEQVQLTGKALERASKTQHEFHSEPKKEPRQVCLAVEAFPFV